MHYAVIISHINKKHENVAIRVKISSSFGLHAEFRQ